jgi:hypothetical protein
MMRMNGRGAATERGKAKRGVRNARGCQRGEKKENNSRTREPNQTAEEGKRKREKGGEE